MDGLNDLIRKLAAAFQRYIGLQREYMMLSLTEKLTILLTALVLGSILFVLGIIAVIFLSLTIVSALIALTGSSILSYGIVTLLYIALCVLIYMKRKPWIVAPLTNFFANLLLDKKDKA